MQDALEPGENMLVDARGHRCPTPTLRLRRALERAAPGTAVVLLADDPMARIDVPHFASTADHELLATEDTAGGLRFTLRRSASAADADRGSRPD